MRVDRKRRADMDEITVALPASLKRDLEGRIEHTEFESLEEYVRFVLQTIVDEDGDRHTDSEREAHEQEQLEDRLKDLGYM
jgi:Arc/MetJ-type ribon-helix-helix transcriptional regulator